MSRYREIYNRGKNRGKVVDSYHEASRLGNVVLAITGLIVAHYKYKDESKLKEAIDYICYASYPNTIKVWGRKSFDFKEFLSDGIRTGKKKAAIQEVINELRRRRSIKAVQRVINKIKEAENNCFPIESMASDKLSKFEEVWEQIKAKRLDRKSRLTRDKVEKFKFKLISFSEINISSPCYDQESRIGLLLEDIEEVLVDKSGLLDRGVHTAKPARGKRISRSDCDKKGAKRDKEIPTSIADFSFEIPTGSALNSEFGLVRGREIDCVLKLIDQIRSLDSIDKSYADLLHFQKEMAKFSNYVIRLNNMTIISFDREGYAKLQNAMERIQREITDPLEEEIIRIRRQRELELAGTQRSFRSRDVSTSYSATARYSPAMETASPYPDGQRLSADDGQAVRRERYNEYPYKTIHPLKRHQGRQARRATSAAAEREAVAAYIAILEESLSVETGKSRKLEARLARSLAVATSLEDSSQDVGRIIGDLTVSPTLNGALVHGDLAAAGVAGESVTYGSHYFANNIEGLKHLIKFSIQDGTYDSHMEFVQIEGHLKQRFLDPDDRASLEALLSSEECREELSEFIAMSFAELAEEAARKQSSLKKKAGLVSDYELSESEEELSEYDSVASSQSHFEAESIAENRESTEERQRACTGGTSTPCSKKSFVERLKNRAAASQIGGLHYPAESSAVTREDARRELLLKEAAALKL